MTQGIKALRRLQIGVESAPGNSTDAPTTVWRGTGVLKDDRVTTFVEEDTGILGGRDRTIVTQTGTSITLTDNATFEQLPYVFGAGIKKAAGVADGGGSGYVYSYAFPTSDAVSDTDLGTLVVIGGDNAGAELARYGYVEAFTLSGNAGEALALSADVKFQGASTDDFVAALTVPTVESMLVSKAKFYIDETTDTIGASLVSKSVLNFTLTVNTGWRGVRTADGSLDYSFAKQVMPEITLQITFEHNDTSVLEKYNWRNQIPRQIRLLVEGNELTSAGTYANKTLVVDLAGKWEMFDALADQDGNDTIAATFRARYNSDADLFAEFDIVNELPALP